MDNQEAARYWLKVAVAADPNSQWTTALYCASDNRLRMTDGTESWESDEKDMDTCLVYLDEEHTRGIDIKLPEKSVAAVILGPNLTKDKLIQSCMRMRNLGYGQCVCFFAPPEVHQQILRYHPDHTNYQINTIDVLSWVMDETCIQLQQNMGLWASQGITYQTRQSVWRPGSKFNKTQFTAAWKEKASKSLTELYSCSAVDKESNSIMVMLDHKLQDQNLREQHGELRAIRDHCREYDIGSLRISSFQEQQEREVEREIQAQHMPQQSRVKIAPHKHKLHPGLVEFIKTGIPPQQQPGTKGSPFCTLEDTLRGTSFANKTGQQTWTCKILATIEFGLTVDSTLSNFETDSHLRPVNWIMSTGFLQKDESLTVILLSPFEVNELLPYIRVSKFVNLHMYSAKMKIRSPSFNDLTIRAIPTILDKDAWREKYPQSNDLMIQVGLYAGALFFDTYEEYRKVCTVVGISTSSCSMGSWGDSRNQNLLKSDYRQHNAITYTKNETHMGERQPGEASFLAKQWNFLPYLVKARTYPDNGDTYLKYIERSHMGLLLRGKVLQESEWKMESSDP